MDHKTIIAAIQTAETAGRAMDLVPEDWGFFLASPNHPTDDFACGILPAGIEGAARRVYERGHAIGRGASRLEAITKAADWLMLRVPQFSEENASC